MAQEQNVNRRDFVKSTAAAAVVSAPFIQKALGANEQVQYAFIGTGSRGSYLIKHLKSVDNGRCVALCDDWDVSLKKGLETLGRQVPTYKDYRELLARKDVDAVYIATPLYQHFPVTKDALLAGKHVFCEKSLVHKPHEVHELRALAHERPKQVLQTGLQRRYSAFYQAAKQMIAKGMIGDVTHVRAQWHRNSSQRRPLPQGAGPEMDRKINWRMYREYAGGNTAELASHQIDIADWMFGLTPEFVVGVGGIDTFKDGRDVYDNIQLIFSYPKGRKLIYSSISTNSHLDLLQSRRTEFGEVIMGTAGTIEITIGDDTNPAVALWYREPAPVNTGTIIKGAQAPPPAAAKAGATMTTAAATRGVPLLLPKDQEDKADSFLAREAKFGRRWLYAKGIMVPEEDRNPVDVELEDFHKCCKTGARPKADLEVGLADSTAVILANLAMDEGRRVYFNEIDKMGRGDAKPAAKAAPKKG